MQLDQTKGHFAAMVGAKVISYEEIRHVQFDKYDSRCYKPFKIILNAKADIKRGKNPTGGYNRALNAIALIDQCSTHLKFYIGYLKAKMMIQKAHKKFLSQ